uniref:G-protein coupled receptors family 1 profile domain-containing protein n=1 Tax=Panagrolaimus sp. PS1159 TaxID=55785 RepID=A0AC35F924_9BILA
MDLHIALVYMPFSLLPLAGTCTLGWPASSGRFTGVHIQFAIFMELFGMYGLSLVIAILYHMSKILGAKTILKSKKGVIYGVFLQFGYSIPMCIVYLMLVPDETQMLNYVSTKAPQANSFIRNYTCATLIPYTSVYLFIGLSGLMGLICSTAVLLCCGLAVLLLLRNRASRNSAEYLKFKVMTIGLIAQLIVPWNAILIPIIWIAEPNQNTSHELFERRQTTPAGRGQSATHR